MTCDRCDDIHKAQREGKTWNECKCSCHYPIGNCTCDRPDVTIGTNFLNLTDDSGSNILLTNNDGCGCHCCNE